jgi:hypothetical protein
MENSPAPAFRVSSRRQADGGWRASIAIRLDDPGYRAIYITNLTSRRSGDL